MTMVVQAEEVVLVQDLVVPPVRDLEVQDLAVRDLLVGPAQDSVVAQQK